MRQHKTARRSLALVVFCLILVNANVVLGVSSFTYQGRWESSPQLVGRASVESSFVTHEHTRIYGLPSAGDRLEIQLIASDLK